MKILSNQIISLINLLFHNLKKKISNPKIYNKQIFFGVLAPLAGARQTRVLADGKLGRNVDITTVIITGLTGGKLHEINEIDQHCAE